VIVVEDGTRGVDEQALAGARLVRLEHVGRSAARNTGVDAATTPLIAFLDDDDLSLPGRIERQRASLVDAPGAPLSFGRVHIVDGDGRPLENWDELLERRFRRVSESGAGFTDVLASRLPIYTSATMVRRDAFLEVGGYDPALDWHEDLDLYLRLSRLGPLVLCPGDAVATYRLHGGNTPSDLLYEGALAVADKHLPTATGRTRRLLVELRVDALWGLGRFREARRDAVRAALRQPLLLGRPLFAKRFAGAALPARLLEARR
jgi:glycosyltransferase involved in cell wall biosynthesis